jgi:7-keto-8-aminopelargonate synthetase-like enzyme
MAPKHEDTSLRYIDPHNVAIEGMRPEEMTIRGTAGKLLGRLQGFVIDPVTEQLRYLVIRTSGVIARTALLPFELARVDVARGMIEVAADERDLRSTQEFFPRWDDRALTT